MSRLAKCIIVISVSKNDGIFYITSNTLLFAMTTTNLIKQILIYFYYCNISSNFNVSLVINHKDKLKTNEL